MRPGAPAPWRFSHRGQDPGLLTLREILDSGRCRAKGRIAAGMARTSRPAGVKTRRMTRPRGLDRSGR